MTDADLSLPQTLALGLVAGLMAGLFGVGGGIILVPGLVLLARLPQHQAHATSLAAIIVTAPAAMIPFALEGEVAWLAAAPLVVGAQVGVRLGAQAMSRIPSRQLRISFAVFMLLVAARLALPGVGGEAAAGVDLSAGGLLVLLAIGLVTGVFSALLGIGGGIVMVSAMVLAAGFDQHLAEGTSLLVIIPTALVGAIRHQRNGYTRWRLGLTVGAGGVLGGLVGGSVAQRLPGDVLQIGFAVLLVVAAVRLLRKREPKPSAAADRHS